MQNFIYFNQDLPPSVVANCLRLRAENYPGPYVQFYRGNVPMGYMLRPGVAVLSGELEVPFDKTLAAFVLLVKS